MGDTDDFTFYDWLAPCGFIINTLVQPRAEALEGLVEILGFPELLVVLSQVRCRYPKILRIKVA